MHIATFRSFVVQKWQPGLASVTTSVAACVPHTGAHQIAALMCTYLLASYSSRSRRARL